MLTQCWRQVAILALLVAVDPSNAEDDASSLAYGDVVPLIQMPGVRRTSRPRSAGRVRESLMVTAETIVFPLPEATAAYAFNGTDGKTPEQGLPKCHPVLLSLNACNVTASTFLSQLLMAVGIGSGLLQPISAVPVPEEPSRDIAETNPSIEEEKDTDASGRETGGFAVLLVLFFFSFCLGFEFLASLPVCRSGCYRFPLSVCTIAGDCVTNLAAGCAGGCRKVIASCSLGRWPRAKGHRSATALTEALPPVILEEVASWLPAEALERLCSTAKSLRKLPREPHVMALLMQEVRRLDIEQEAVFELQRAASVDAIICHAEILEKVCDASEAASSLVQPTAIALPASSVLRRFLAARRRRLIEDVRRRIAADREQVVTEFVRFVVLGMLFLCFLGEVLHLARPEKDPSPLIAIKALIIPIMFLYTLEKANEPISTLTVGVAAIWLLYDCAHRELGLGRSRH